MKLTRLILMMISIFFFGCMKSQIKDSLVVPTNEKQFAAATVLSIQLNNENFAECVEKSLKKDLPNLKFIPENRFRNSLFPWFEYRTAPKDAKELSALLSKPLIRSQIERIGVEILVYVHGATSQDKMKGPGFCGGAGGAFGCLGYLSADRETHMATTVWNLKEGILIGNTDIHFQGKVRMPMFLIPIPIPAFTQSAACNETARRISNCLRGKASHNK